MKRIGFIVLVCLGCFVGISFQNDLNEQCIETTTNMLRSKYEFNSYGEFVGFLYEVCIQDRGCTKAYFQHNHKNFTNFKFLIGGLLAKYSQKVGSIYFDGVSTLAMMLCDKDDWFNTGHVQASYLSSISTDFNYFDQDHPVARVTNNVVEHIFNSSALYQMYSHASSSTPNCGLNQKLIVSEDGTMVSCVCQETQNCAVSMHNTIFTDVSLGLIIVFEILLLAVVGIEASYRTRIWNALKKPLRKDTESTLRMIAEY